MEYIMAAKVFPNDGEYHIREISKECFVIAVTDGKAISYVGHAGTAEYLQRLTGIHTPVNRSMVYMRPGDIAWICTPAARLDRVADLSYTELEKLPVKFYRLHRLA